MAKSPNSVTLLADTALPTSYGTWASAAVDARQASKFTVLLTLTTGSITTAEVKIQVRGQDDDNWYDLYTASGSSAPLSAVLQEVQLSSPSGTDRRALELDIQASEWRMLAKATGASDGSLAAELISAR